MVVPETFRPLNCPLVGYILFLFVHIKIPQFKKEKEDHDVNNVCLFTDIHLLFQSSVSSNKATQRTFCLFFVDCLFHLKGYLLAGLASFDSNTAGHASTLHTTVAPCSSEAGLEPHDETLLCH